MPFAIQCPSCKRKLNVPDKVAGKRVKCPGCGEAFLAKAPEPEFVEPEVVEPAAEAVAIPVEDDEPDKKPEAEAVAIPVEDDRPDEKPRRRPREDDDQRVSAKPQTRGPKSRDDDDDRVSAKRQAPGRKSRDDDDEDDDRPSRRRRSRDDEDEDDDRPRRRRRRDDEDDDDYGIRRRARPHRGGLVMTLGIIALVVCCCPFAGWIVGSIAVSMANTDLTAMKSGYMDDSGQGNTTAGKICGTIAVGLATAIFVFNIITWVMNPFHF